MRLIDADATIKYLREYRCKDCDKRKGMKNDKVRFCYEIGDAPCRACDIGDTIDYFLDEDISPTIDAVPVKEQEAKYPVCEKCGNEIDHINTSVFNYDGSDSDYSIPITYSKENGFVSFSTSQNWTGYDLTDEERKEGIRCPYCGKFPFDDSIEIEFYEPVEVMMWTSEGR